MGKGGKSRLPMNLQRSKLNNHRKKQIEPECGIPNHNSVAIFLK